MRSGSTARLGYLAVALVCLALGSLGAFLPILPSTPLLLVSVWGFSRSSPRLERWLLDHPRFGPRLRAFRDDRVIPLPVKLTAWGTMIVSLTGMALSGAPWPALVATALLMVWGAVYIARCPSRPARRAPPA